VKVKVKPFKAENPMKAGSAIGEFLAAIGVTATTKTTPKSIKRIIAMYDLSKSLRYYQRILSK
jgi:hypothetical protein